MSFETCNQEAYSCKYAENSKVKLGFHVDSDPNILKRFYCEWIIQLKICHFEKDQPVIYHLLK